MIETVFWIVLEWVFRAAIGLLLLAMGMAALCVGAAFIVGMGERICNVLVKGERW